MSGDATASIASLVIFILLLIYVIGGAYIEKRKFVVGHETGIAILIGFTISLILFLSQEEKVRESFNFDEKLFFYVCLPPILFSSGFNMRRRRFF